MNISHDEEEEKDLGKLCDTLHAEFANMGKALQCPVCQSTICDAVVLPCVHAYCRDCVLATFKSQGKQENHRCPICQGHANRRSITPSPTLNQLAKAYKLALRHFGLAPIQHDPSYVAMTQIAPDQQQDYDDDPFFTNNDDDDDDYANISYHESSARRKSHKLLASHTQLMVSKTWERIFEKRQLEKEDEEEAQLKQRTTRSSSTGSNNNTNYNSSLLLLNNGRSAGQNNNSKNNLNAWHRQQQQAVCKSHERLLLDSLRDKQRGPSPTPTIDLSMQQEISYEEGLDQEVANRQMEELHEEWKRQEEEAKAKAKADEEKKQPTPATGQLKEDDEEKKAKEESVAAAASGDNDEDDNDKKPQPQDDGNAKPEHFPGAKSKATATTASNPINSNSTAGTQDCFFTPREIDSQQSKSTSGGATASQTLVDMSSMLQASNNNNNNNASRRNNSNDEEGSIARTNPKPEDSEEEEPLALSMAESFKSARSSDDADVAEQENSHEGTRQHLQQQAQPPLRHQESNSNINSNTEVKEQEEKVVAPVDRRTPRQSNSTASRIRSSRISSSSSNHNPNPRHTANSAGTTANNNDGESGENNGATPSNYYRIGSLVRVQDRTWSGINKPGGIARITKVIADAATYDVAYILGGREKNVDAFFLSLPPEEMEWAASVDSATGSNAAAAAASSSSFDHGGPTSTNSNNNASRGRKSKRISTRVELIKSEEEEAAAVLPPDLLEQLAKEGFDVTPVASASTTATNRRGRGGGGGSATVRFSAPPSSTTVIAAGAGGNKKRSRSESSSTRKPPANRARRATTARTRSKPIRVPASSANAKEKSSTTTVGRPQIARKNQETVSQGRARKKPPVLQPQTATKQEGKDQQARNVQPNSVGEDKKVAAAKKKTAPNNKRRKTVVSKRQEQVPASASTVELCSLANDHYKQRIQEDIDSGSICVVTTGLSEGDKAALKALCKSLKQNGGVQIKQSETPHPKKTTLCLLPASPSRDDSSNLVAKCRTIKGMVCTLHGVPLVASSWIQACRDNNNQVTMPSDSNFVRSLPVKTPNTNGFSDCGVAKLAVQTTLLGTHHVLQAFTAQLCGSFSRPPKADMQQLLREAGAEVSLQNQETISFLNEMDAGGSSLVLICDDTCASINPDLYGQVEAISKGIETKEVLVVNPQWLFDSIAAGTALPMGPYPPALKNGQPLNLFKALQP